MGASCRDYSAGGKPRYAPGGLIDEGHPVAVAQA
jgi:hypothetical protein